jgi:hypothetical protein
MGIRGVMTHDVAPKGTERHKEKDMKKLIDNLVDNIESISALDEMLGLVNYVEMYEARNLPVVAVLKPNGSEDGETSWAIVSGERRRDDYLVRGIFFCAGADGFTGTLSLDGTKLIIEDREKAVEFAQYTSLGCTTRGVHLNSLIGEFSGIYAPFDASEYAVTSATAVARRIEGGEPVYEALMSERKCPSDSLSPTFASLKGWYRAHRKRLIMDEHRDEFRRSAEPLAMRYAPIAKDLVSLNREIGSVKRGSIRRSHRRVDHKPVSQREYDARDLDLLDDLTYRRAFQYMHLVQRLMLSVCRRPSHLGTRSSYGFFSTVARGYRLPIRRGLWG